MRGRRRTTTTRERGAVSCTSPAPCAAALFGLVLAGLLFAGCRATVPIGQLTSDPHEFDGRKVKVEGEVTGAAGALGRGAYVVDDGTGSLVVVSEERGVPRAGSRVAVTGWFRSLLTVGSLGAAVLLERDRDLRDWRTPPPAPPRLDD